MSSTTSERYPFYEHISEARNRLLICCVFLIVGTVFGYLLHQDIVAFLLNPINQPLYYSSPAGGFDLTVRISFLFGCLVTIPVLMYQVVKFIEPTLSVTLSKQVPLVIVVSSLLLLAGMAFAYFVSFPAALYFLNKFSTSSIQALISTTEYFDLLTRYLLGFGLLFQLPLMLLLINSVKKISTHTLMKYQRWVLLGSFIIAAVLTPTADIFNQLIMAGPLILLYQASIVMLAWINKK